ncbi:MAG TPA: RNA polymerase-binding protein DksA [Steroidobacteraceae bacterium]
MPSKKPNKAAKRPGKATPKKAAHKAAAPKKAARPPTKAKPIATSKVTVKPTKPAMKPVIAKVAITKTPQAKPAAPKPAAPKPAALKPVPTPVAPKASANGEKIAPIKFDPRPLVMPRMLQNDEDGDAESSVSASLLAGPRNVKPYIARRGEQYMNKEQLEHFARILQNWKRDLMVEVDRTVLHMKDEAANFPDPNDRATQEEEFSLELRTRDRERKLIRKIDEALKRIEDGSYGYCLETGEEIGIKRLEARPVATLSVEAQERRERREKQYGDRDDRYR